MQNEKTLQLKSKKIYDIKKRSYLFALEIIKLIKSLNKDFSTEIIAKQLLRSATSIGANIIEGQASSSKKDFVNFHTHSLKSANETKFWLGLLRDSNMADKEQVNFLLEETKELANIVASIVISAKNKRY